VYTEILKTMSAVDLWIASLQPTEREVATVALRAFERIVVRCQLVGGCYLLSFFLHKYLNETRGICSEVVVGWVNDGTSPVMSSHAWIETTGKRTDISLSRTEEPNVQLPGALLVLEHVVRPGKAIYTYHRKRWPESIDAIRHLDQETVTQSEVLHAQMERVAKSDNLIDEYFASAPLDLNYKSLTLKMQ
jgi:hypothetical protein